MQIVARGKRVSRATPGSGAQNLLRAAGAPEGSVTKDGTQIVETRSGQEYQLGELYYLDYKNVRIARGNLAVAATQAAMMAGSKRVTVELVFEAGKAIIPPLTANQPELLGLLETMPVQRRDDGQVRQN